MSKEKFVNIGYGNLVSFQRVVAMVDPDSAPIKRMIQEAREEGRVVDATYGRKTRGVILTDSGHVILSAILPETLGNRLVAARENSNQVLDAGAAE